jgi:uncharacterized protein YheU (UPF0270 family)
MNMRLLLMALASCACTHAARADALEDFVGLQVGSFSSEAQARQDASYDAITWHVAEIWADDDPAERWLYTESWIAQAPSPYMQRVTRLRVEPDGTITARRYTMPEAARFVGAWQQPARIAALKPGDLTEIVGCDTVVTRAGTDYGSVEKTLEQKMADIRRQLVRGEAKILFDPDTDTANIVIADSV